MAMKELEDSKIYSNPYFFCCDAWNKLYPDGIDASSNEMNSIQVQKEDENRYLRAILCFNEACETKIGTYTYYYPFLMRIGSKQLTLEEFYHETDYVPLFTIKSQHGKTFKMSAVATIENLNGDFNEQIKEAISFIRPFNKKWIGMPNEFTDEMKVKVKMALDKMIIPYEENGDFIIVQSEEAIISCYDPLLIPVEYSHLKIIYPDMMIFRKGSKTKEINETIISLGYFSGKPNAHDHLAVIMNGHVCDWMVECLKAYKVQSNPADMN